LASQKIISEAIDTAGKTISEMGTSLTHKNLLHPANWNILFDFLMVIVILGLALFDGYFKITDIPFGAIIIICLIFIFLCFIYMCASRDKNKS